MGSHIQDFFEHLCKPNGQYTSQMANLQLQKYLKCGFKDLTSITVSLQGKGLKSNVLASPAFTENFTKCPKRFSVAFCSLELKCRQFLDPIDIGGFQISPKKQDSKI